MKKRLFSIIIFIIIFSVAAVPVPASAFTVSPSYAKNIEAEIYSLVCLTRDNTVLTAKNTGRKVFPGSLTCIMTALVAADNIADLSEEFEVSEDAVAALANSGALGCDLSSGEIMSAENHLYRLLISSAADSATALAFHISDSLEAFTELMNKKAEELGMSNTRFANCTGFYDENSYTTAEDLTKLAISFLQNPTLKKIAGTTSYKIPATNKKSERTVTTANLMMMGNSGYYYTYCNGLKYSASQEGGRHILATASYEGMDYLCVVLDCPLKDEDGNTKHIEMTSAKQLFRWAFLTLSQKNAVDTNVPISEIPVELSLTDYVSLVPEKDIYVLVPGGSEISYNIYLNSPSAEAPIKKGDVLGYADIICAGECVGQVNLVAQNDVDSNLLLLLWNRFLKVVTSKIFLTVISVLIAAAIVTVWTIIQINKKRKAKRKRSQYRKF